MYQTRRTFIEPRMDMVDLINENHMFLLFLQHMGVDFNVGDRTVEDICREYGLSLTAFIGIANLYNGFVPGKETDQYLKKDIPTIIKFLKESHTFYKNDKYPEIIQLIKELQHAHPTKDVSLIEDFFNDYFEEVLEHLDYEEEIAFPYFCNLIEQTDQSSGNHFSVKEYRDHHSDIETKLADLKSLLLKHIRLDNNLSLRRKFLNSLFELEYDLSIHSEVEELILLPVIDRIERAENG